MFIATWLTSTCSFILCFVWERNQRPYLSSSCRDCFIDSKNCIYLCICLHCSWDMPGWYPSFTTLDSIQACDIFPPSVSCIFIEWRIDLRKRETERKKLSEKYNYIHHLFIVVVKFHEFSEPGCPSLQFSGEVWVLCPWFTPSLSLSFLSISAL